ncbi:serine threonine-protein kinase [Colletotrichum musicola]|uniref:Serine threonine-protein kinase n=1 Tax=Colletotrichum musicola TaxID=2175873 RepID=A0A8H6N406_9PEZI|nr:serine threonine-protein kinase [Colletotrichum musicola]
MQDWATLRSRGYRGHDRRKLKLIEPVHSFPLEILHFADTLEHLDLSGTGLSSIPDDFGQLRKLKIAFFSECNFAVFPAQLAKCPELEMVAFRSNGMTSIPEDALPTELRWLILTNNCIEYLPKSIGRCSRLQKCMLAGNRLGSLPEDMSACKKLGLLRISANNFDHLPQWLFEMPELAFLSTAGNPCCDQKLPQLRQVSWHDLEIGNLLGHGASGDIYRAKWMSADSAVDEVAVKLFRGEVTSDGRSLDEMAACIAAGSHEHLINTLATVEGHPKKYGLLMQLISPRYRTLGLPPSLQTCTRDRYPEGMVLPFRTVVQVLFDIASAALHLHRRKVSHCDLYAHNILFNDAGRALLGDLGAATVYGDLGHLGFEKIEVLALGYLIQDLLGLTDLTDGADKRQHVQELMDLQAECLNPVVKKRPTFSTIIYRLQVIIH